MRIRYRKINSEMVEPTYATPGSTCFDLYSVISQSIDPGKVAKIKLGFAVELPKGYYMELRPRSGMNQEGIFLLMGTVDHDYRGEVCVLLYNSTDCDYNIKPKDRIGQGLIKRFTRSEFWEVDHLTQTRRGKGGFGSTGR
jgi:dUTP pyrophosphatase